MIGDSIYTLDDVDLTGKRVLVRVDLNSSIENNHVVDNPRFDGHAKTIKELVEKKCRVVLLSHQGRPGESDFTSNREHAAILEKKLGAQVEFVPDVCGAAALERIKALQEGQVLMLDNVRLMGEEMLEQSAAVHSKDMYVQRLAPLFDAFVNDAYSTSHRSHASMVGFPVLLPAIAGRVMQREIESNSRIAENLYGPTVFLIGGVKFKEALTVTEAVATRRKAGSILTSGAVGLLFLEAKGVKLGEKTENALEKMGAGEFGGKARSLVEKYRELIATPLDVAMDEDRRRKEYPVTELPINLEIKDIGKRTIKAYTAAILGAKSLFAKGAPGLFEEKQFEEGTREIAKAIISSKCFSVVGGGSLVTAFKRFGLDLNSISHVSLSGGALLDHLASKKLPGVEALKHTL